MTKSEWKSGQRPKLLSPINSFEGAIRVIHAGADEIYCGVAMPGKLKNFVMYRGPGSTGAQLPTYDELGKIVEYAHNNNVKVLLVANEPFMSEALESEMKNHIRSCVDKGVDALIIGDLGVLSIVRDLGVDLPLYASTYFVSMNYEATDFLRKLGFSRVILERHLTLREIAEVVRHSKVDIEVFCHVGGCSNINANCYLYHVVTPRIDFEMKSKLWKMERGIDEDTKKGVFHPISPCTLFFEVYDVNNVHTRICKAPIMDAATQCSLCHIPALVQAGVTGLKIVGRFDHVLNQEAYTRIYRELIDLIGQVTPDILQEKIDSLKKEFEKKTLIKEKRGRNVYWFRPQSQFCEQKRCYYGSLFHVPYESYVSLRNVRS